MAKKKKMKSLRSYFSGSGKLQHPAFLLLFVVTFAGLGVYLLIGSHAAAPYASVNADSGTPASGAIAQSCAGASDGKCVTFKGTGGGTQTTNCFPSPGACGYPDPAYGTVGVPAGTTLSASAGFTASTAGATYNALDVTGSIDVTAKNVTIQNSRITQNDSCGSTNACGNAAIYIESGVTGLTINHVETRTASGDTCEHDIRNKGGTILVENAYLHACDSNIYTVDPGATTLNDSYGIAKIDISADHIENIYMNDNTFSANHDTLFNPVGQTAVVFGNVNTGFGGSCVNHLTVSNSFFAGSGYILYPCGNASSAGSSSMSVTNTHFGRSPNDGYYPSGGYYGVAAYIYCPPTSGMTWSGNVWDDNNSTVSC